MGWTDTPSIICLVVTGLYTIDHEMEMLTLYQNAELVKIYTSQYLLHIMPIFSMCCVLCNWVNTSLTCSGWTLVDRCLFRCILNTRKLVYTMQQFLNLLVCLKVVILIMMGSGFLVWWCGYPDQDEELIFCETLKHPPKGGSVIL